MHRKNQYLEEALPLLGIKVEYSAHHQLHLLQQAILAQLEGVALVQLVVLAPLNLTLYQVIITRLFRKEKTIILVKALVNFLVVEDLDEVEEDLDHSQQL